MLDLTLKQKQEIAKSIWFMVLGVKVPDLRIIRQNTPSPIDQHLRGNLDLENPNVYILPGVGPVISYNLIQDKGVVDANGWSKDPTLGLFTRGKYDFSTGDDITEKIICLSGEYQNLITNRLEKPFAERKFHPNLKIEVYNPFLYVCQYVLRK